MLGGLDFDFWKRTCPDSPLARFIDSRKKSEGRRRKDNRKLSGSDDTKEPEGRTTGDNINNAFKFLACIKRISEHHANRNRGWAKLTDLHEILVKDQNFGGEDLSLKLKGIYERQFYNWLNDLETFGVIERSKKGRRAYRICQNAMDEPAGSKSDPIPCEWMFARHPDLIKRLYSLGAYVYPLSTRKIELPELAVVFSRRLYAAKLALSDRHVKDVDSLIDDICKKEFDDPDDPYPYKTPEFHSITGTSGYKVNACKTCSGNGKVWSPGDLKNTECSDCGGTGRKGNE